MCVKGVLGGAQSTRFCPPPAPHTPPGRPPRVPGPRSPPPACSAPLAVPTRRLLGAGGSRPRGSAGGSAARSRLVGAPRPPRLPAFVRTGLQPGSGQGVLEARAPAGGGDAGPGEARLRGAQRWEAPACAPAALAAPGSSSAIRTSDSTAAAAACVLVSPPPVHGQRPPINGHEYLWPNFSLGLARRREVSLYFPPVWNKNEGLCRK